MYVGVKTVDRKAVEAFLSDYTILPLDAVNFDWAFRNTRNSDFEDALQIAVALKNGCDEFVTLDKRLAKIYDNLPTMRVTLL